MSRLNGSRGRGRVLECSLDHYFTHIFCCTAGGVEQLDALLGRTDSLPSSPGSRKSSVSPDRSGECSNHILFSCLIIVRMMSYGQNSL